MNSIYLKNLVVTTAVVASTVFYIGSRYQFGVDQQGEGRCLHATVFIMDKWDKEFESGDLLVFNTNGTNYGFADNVLVTKIVAGIGGEEISFTSKEVYSNSGFHINSDIEKGSEVLGTKINPNELTIKEDEYFLVGERPFSYDSRYWGSLNKKYVVGKAYAIF